MLVIVIIMAFLVLRDYGCVLDFWTYNFQLGFKIAIYCLMVYTVVLTIISGALFFMRNKRIIYEKGPH